MRAADQVGEGRAGHYKGGAPAMFPVYFQDLSPEVQALILEGEKAGDRWKKLWEHLVDCASQPTDHGNACEWVLNFMEELESLPSSPEVKP